MAYTGSRGDSRPRLSAGRSPAASFNLPKLKSSRFVSGHPLQRCHKCHHTSPGFSRWRGHAAGGELSSPLPRISTGAGALRLVPTLSSRPEPECSVLFQPCHLDRSRRAATAEWRDLLFLGRTAMHPGHAHLAHRPKAHSVKASGEKSTFNAAPLTRVISSLANGSTHISRPCFTPATNPPRALHKFLSPACGQPALH
jgi:hypothetical protein